MSIKPQQVKPPAITPEKTQEYTVISNNGVPQDENNMSNQCFWISLLD